MTLIHTHEDDNGCTLDVATVNGGLLQFDTEGTLVYATPAKVRALHTALGFWLAANGVTQKHVEPVYVQADVFRATVREEIARALKVLAHEADRLGNYEDDYRDSAPYNAIGSAVRATVENLGE